MYRLVQLVFITALLFLVACSSGAPMAAPTQAPAAAPTSTTAPSAEPTSPPVESSSSPTVGEAEAAGVTLVCSAGDSFTDCGGPSAVTGEAGSGNFAISAELFPNPTVALIDATPMLRGEPVFVPDAGQIFGYFTEPFFPGPGKLRVNLPIAPAGTSLDLDHDGQNEAGVQVYALHVASNLISDPYLQQLEQLTGLSSVITDIATGAVTEGSFLVYAPDGLQSFPAANGADSRWFTEDDPVITLPPGYTLATLAVDGRVTLDRSPEVTLNTIERTEQKSPDFSDQGILESFNSLIEVLKQRYAYTGLRNLDWDEIRARYLPQVEAAEANQDMVAYYLALKEMAQSIGDGHVAATTFELDAVLADAKMIADQLAGSLGASTFAVVEAGAPLDSIGERILVLTVGENTPAANAGWVPGTEIVSINGEPVLERLAQVPLIKSYGTLVSRRKAQAASILNFPLGASVTVAYRLPDSSEVLSATLVAGEYDSGGTAPARVSTPVTYEQEGEYAIVRWSNFSDNLLPKIAVLEEALGIERDRESGGMILDLRSNSGGLAQLYETMASYFFTADDPMPLDVFDWYRYDEAAGKHMLTFSPGFTVSAPRPELAYSGPVVVLVDEACASACEYFTQHLQVLKRATVVGQYSSDGAGGFIERVKMPGNISFQFTQGGTYFAGTDEPNLEAKGVIPDIQVPVTLDTETAKLRGEDPVVAAALAFLDQPTNQLTGTTWLWSVSLDASLNQTPVPDPSSYSLAFAEDGSLAIKADCNQASGSYTTDADGNLTITVGPATLAACPEGSLSETFMGYLSAVQTYTFEGKQLGLILKPDSGPAALLFDPGD